MPYVSKTQLTAFIVANKILDFCAEHGDLLCNLKLQKLLFYTQAWHLALYGRPLFLEEIEASKNGPCQPGVYSYFTRFGQSAIVQVPSDYKVSTSIMNHIQDVMEAYVHLSEHQLEIISRDEEPWKFASRTKSKFISHSLMKKFYKMRLEEQREVKSSTQ